MKTIGLLPRDGSACAVCRLGHDLHRHDHGRQRPRVAAAGDPGRQRQRGRGHHRRSTSWDPGVQTIAPASALPTDHRRRHDRRLHAAGGERQHERSRPGHQRSPPDRDRRDERRDRQRSRRPVLRARQRRQRRSRPRRQSRQVGRDPRLGRRRDDGRRQLHRNRPHRRDPLGNTDFGILANNGPSSVTIGGASSRGAQPDLRQRGRTASTSARPATAAPGTWSRATSIGTDASGGNALAGAQTGVEIDSSSSIDITIGGTTAAARNVISGNGGYGIRSQQRVEPRRQRKLHRHGRHRDGAASATCNYGVFVEANGSTIGGSAPGAGNVISGNAIHGMEISSATGVTSRATSSGPTSPARSRSATEPGHLHPGQRRHHRRHGAGRRQHRRAQRVRRHRRPGLGLGQRHPGQLDLRQRHHRHRPERRQRDRQRRSGRRHRPQRPARTIRSSISAVPAGALGHGNRGNARQRPLDRRTPSISSQPGVRRPPSRLRGRARLHRLGRTSRPTVRVMPRLDARSGIHDRAGPALTVTATDPAGNTSELSPRIVFSISPVSGPARGGPALRRSRHQLRGGSDHHARRRPRDRPRLPELDAGRGRTPALSAGSLERRDPDQRGRDPPERSPRATSRTSTTCRRTTRSTPTSRRSSPTGSRPASAAATTASRRARCASRWRSSCSRRSTASATCRRACTPGFFADVPCPAQRFAPWIEALANLGHHGRLRWRQLLPRQPRPPRPDGRVPAEGGARIDLRAAGLHAAGSLHRRGLPRDVHELDRAPRGREHHGRLRGGDLLPGQPEHAGTDGGVHHKTFNLQ